MHLSWSTEEASNGFCTSFCWNLVILLYTHAARQNAGWMKTKWHQNVMFSRKKGTFYCRIGGGYSAVSRPNLIFRTKRKRSSCDSFHRWWFLTGWRDWLHPWAKMLLLSVDPLTFHMVWFEIFTWSVNNSCIIRMLLQKNIWKQMDCSMFWAAVGICEYMIWSWKRFPLATHTCRVGSCCWNRSSLCVCKSSIERFKN